ncbi:GNAT family N-acetyltransferase [Paenibacillus sp. FSL M7-1046]|uniref:GNAT family N-acetyltransferase n=1 Tax=Paenibacillus sp. FSL M7-1046 TaxID=2975315 RepID=UPI0030FC92BB
MKWDSIYFSRLTEDDLELVRNWRNDEKISKFMQYRSYISPEMQLKWYKTINNTENFYFIIMYDELKIGLANIKDIDWDRKCGEVGIFIYEETYLNSLLPYVVSLKGLELDFKEYNLQYVYAHILKTNKRAIRFNKSFGFELEPHQETVENQKYILTRENYEKNAYSLEKIIRKSMN